MASELPINTILSIGKLSQVLANIANQKNNLFKSQTLDARLPCTIYEVWKPLSLRYAANPSDPTVRGVAEYLLQLCGPYALQARKIISGLTVGLPSLTGPSNQSVSVGQTATFSVSVAGTGPFTYQWFLNNSAIAGATSSSYSKTNAQLSDSGGIYKVQVSNAAGSVFSNTATLNVSAALVGYYYQGTTDYSTQLLSAIDNVPYLGTFPITTGQPFTVTFPNIGASQSVVVKYPVGEPTKTHYENPPGGFDSASIPGLAFDVTTIGGWKYIFSRNGNPLGLNNINGQVKFS